jgi:hypothetical protein
VNTVPHRLAALIGLTALGCNHDALAATCAEPVEVSIYPLAMTLSVGASARISATMAIPCAKRTIPADLRLQSSDPATVRVIDSIPGGIIADAPGTATVQAVARFDTSYHANVVVTVEP